MPLFRSSLVRIDSDLQEKNTRQVLIQIPLFFHFYKSDLRLQMRKRTLSNSLKKTVSFCDENQDLNSEEIVNEKLLYLKIYLVGMMLFVNHYSIFVIPSFLPFMVQDFFPNTALSDLGLELGILSSAFNVGQFVSSIVWGKAADKFGRRPILISGLIGTLFGTLLFGFSVNFYMAVVARFLWGALNGNIAIAKTYLSEICDDKTQAKGFGVIGTAQSVGRLLGPIAGGYLANPVAVFPSVFAATGLFGQFKYLLPILTGAVICMIIIPLSYVFIEESLPAEMRSSISSGSTMNSFKNESVWSIMRNNLTIMKAASLFVLLSFISSFVEEMFPLWLATDQGKGGFSMKEKEIAQLMIITAPVGIFSQTFLFSKSIFKFGYKKVFGYSMILLAICIFMLPFSNNFFNFSMNYTKSYIFLAFCMGFFLVGRFFSFASVYALINNSCVQERGAVNGAAQSASSIFKIIAALSGNWLYSQTVIVNSSYAFDFHFVFYISCFLSFVTSFITFTLPESINQKPKSRATLESRLLTPKSENESENCNYGSISQSQSQTRIVVAK
jgi:MFS family permease